MNATIIDLSISQNTFFLVEDTLLNKTSVVLICEGLDTVADVYINTVLVGQSTNMFQRYVWEVKKALVSGSNKIMIKFTSAVTYGAYKSQSVYNYTIPPNCPPAVQHGECHVNLLRKKQCSFSWVSYFNH
jgi:beta-mannosidase